MDCTKADNLLMKYMDNVLNEQEAQELKYHLDSCPACHESFLIYDAMLDNFDTTMYEAPMDLEENVMARVRQIPMPDRQSKVDKWVYTLWGVFSAIFGLGFVVAFNSTYILNWMSTSSIFKNYHDTLAPLAGVSQTFVSNIYASAINGLEVIQRFLQAYYPVMLIALVIFVVIQVVVIRQWMKKEKQTDSDK